MLTAPLVPFVLGCIAIASLTVSLFFLRFHRETRDPLFLYFAAAFGVEAISRTVMAFQTTPNEGSPYLLRPAGVRLFPDPRGDLSQEPLTASTTGPAPGWDGALRRSRRSTRGARGFDPVGQAPAQKAYPVRRPVTRGSDG